MWTLYLAPSEKETQRKGKEKRTKKKRKTKKQRKMKRNKVKTENGKKGRVDNVEK